jgi:transposase-like protein
MAEKRRQFTREFKLQAVHLVSSGERKLAELARDLGVRADILRGWQKQAEGRAGLKNEDVFPGNGKLTSKDEEIRARRVREPAALSPGTESNPLARGGRRRAQFPGT